MNDNTRPAPTLVLNGTGKVGRRVVERLTARGLPVRIGSRSGEPRFDWEDRSTWGPVLEGVGRRTSPIAWTRFRAPRRRWARSRSWP